MTPDAGDIVTDAVSVPGITLDDARTLAAAYALLGRIENENHSAAWASDATTSSIRAAAHVAAKASSALSAIADLLIGSDVYANTGHDVTKLMADAT